MDFDVSVIIPCYNSGEFLLEAISSVESSITSVQVEIIIINDGSTNKTTISLLQKLTQKGYTIIHQLNAGPAAARNAGVKKAQGKYFLFLDSDNKIRNNFIEHGVSVLKSNVDIGVAYGNAEMFGKSLPSFKTGSFDLKKLLAGNYIDMCAMIKRELWSDIGPFDESAIIRGNEDWDYWIRVGNSKWKFHYSDQILFDYRIREDSLTRQIAEADASDQILNYIYSKHVSIVIKSYIEIYSNHNYLKTRPFKAGIDFFYRYLKKKLVRVK